MAKSFLTTKYRHFLGLDELGNKKYTDWEIKGNWVPNLLTNAGRDFIHNQTYITPAATPVAQYVAVTTDTAAAAAGDTTLASEATTNGLARAAATTDTH